MRRYTYVLKVLGEVISSFSLRRRYSLGFGANQDAAATVDELMADIAALGAMEGDMAAQNRSREAGVGAWLNHPTTTWTVTVTYITSGVVSEFEYNIIPDKDAGQPMRLRDFLDRFSNPIDQCLTSLVGLARAWHFRRDSGWRLMGLIWDP